jgi:hypothetical protein
MEAKPGECGLEVELMDGLGRKPCRQGVKNGHEALGNEGIAAPLKVKAGMGSCGVEVRKNPDLADTALDKMGGGAKLGRQRGKGAAQFDDFFVAIFPAVKEIKSINKGCEGRWV